MYVLLPPQSTGNGSLDSHISRQKSGLLFSGLKVMQKTVRVSDVIFKKDFCINNITYGQKVIFSCWHNVETRVYSSQKIKTFKKGQTFQEKSQPLVTLF